MASLIIYYGIFCYTPWAKKHQRDMEAIILALSRTSDEATRRALYAKMLNQFQKYLQRSWVLDLKNTTPLFCQSFQWMGSCRPTMFIRLMLMICGMETADQSGTGSLGELSRDQRKKIRKIQVKTRKEEDALQFKVDSIQEGFMYMSLKEMQKDFNTNFSQLEKLFKEADELRVDTLKDVLDILTPFQVIDLVISLKKLIISLHSWDITLHGSDEEDDD